MCAGTKFRQVLAENCLVEAMAAHSPLSAMLVAEAGFDAIWASGFELSAMYGVPDVSVVSMTQHLDMTRAMAERSGIPVVADIDTGFGNAINVLYAVEQYECAGAAARERADALAGFDRLVVVGVKTTVSPALGAQRLEQALDAHHYTDGLAFLPQGTPTNMSLTPY